MHDLIVLGSGRSGTSAAASLFRKVPGVFYGYEMLHRSPSNPRGYYEDEVVNAINNVLLRQMTGVALLDLVPARMLPLVGRAFPWTHRDVRSLWIARPRHHTGWRMGYELGHLIARITAHRPFCLKDPRFCFTLPSWAPYLPPDVRSLVVVRDPRETVRSMLRDAQAQHGRPLALTEAWAYQHWQAAHESILRQLYAASDRRRWMVVRFADILDGSALPAISRFAGCELDEKVVERRLTNSLPVDSADEPRPSCLAVYDRVCTEAAEDLRHWSAHPG